MEREAWRIGYQSMLRKGWFAWSAVAGRRILHNPDARRSVGHKRVAFRSRFVHIAVGYPGLRFLRICRSTHSTQTMCAS